MARLKCLAVLLLAPASINVQSANPKPEKPRRPTPTASLTLSAEAVTFKAGSPIKVKAVLKNTWNDEILCVWNTYDQFVHVDVRDADGKLAPETERGKAMNGHGGKPRGGGSVYAPTFKPGESFEFHEQVDMLYTLKPGMHTVQVDTGAIAIGSREIEPTTAWIKSNVITITVTE